MLLMISYLFNILLSSYFCYEAITEAPESVQILASEFLWILHYSVMITVVIVSSTSMTREVSEQV